MERMFFWCGVWRAAVIRDGSCFVLVIQSSQECKQYRIMKEGALLSVGGTQHSTLDECVQQMRETPIMHGDELLRPTFPVDGCWIHRSTAERLAQDAGYTAPLDASAWYAIQLNKETAIEAVCAAEPGSFLVRKASDKKSFVLMAKTGDSYINYNIHSEGGNFRIGAGPTALICTTLSSIVVSLRDHTLQTSEGSVQLGSPVPGLDIHESELARIIHAGKTISEARAKQRIETINQLARRTTEQKAVREAAIQRIQTDKHNKLPAGMGSGPSRAKSIIDAHPTNLPRPSRAQSINDAHPTNRDDIFGVGNDARVTTDERRRSEYDLASRETPETEAPSTAEYQIASRSTTPETGIYATIDAVANEMAQISETQPLVVSEINASNGEVSTQDQAEGYIDVATDDDDEDLGDLGEAFYPTAQEPEDASPVTASDDVPRSRVSSDVSI